MELISYDSMRTRKATALFLLIQMEQEEQLLQAQDLLLQVKYYFLSIFHIKWHNENHKRASYTNTAGTRI
jgi:hypothetical protein